MSAPGATMNENGVDCYPRRAGKESIFKGEKKAGVRGLLSGRVLRPIILVAE